MSVRPREAFEASQSFSLRDALGANPAAPQIPASTGSGLKFNLAALNKPVPVLSTPPPTPQSVQAPASWSLKFAQTPVAEPKTTLTTQTPRALPSQMFTSIAQGNGKLHSIIGGGTAAAAAKESVVNKADVMRLTAYVDVMNQRLKEAQTKLEQTEAQLTRTSQVLYHERKTSDMTLDGYRRDLAQAHENEAKIRADLAQAKNRTTLKDNAFMKSVESALASDEQVSAQQCNLAELETKVAAMGDFKVKLEAEIAKIEGLRNVAQKNLDELRAAHEATAAESKATHDDLAATQSKLRDVKANHDSIMERLKSARLDEAILEKAVASLRSDKASAELETQEAKKQTQALLLEHGNTALLANNVRIHIRELEAKEAETKVRLEELKQKCTEAAAMSAPVLAPSIAPSESMSDFELDLAATSSCALHEEDGICADEGGNKMQPATTSVAPRRATISGAQAPTRSLCSGVQDTEGAWRAAMPMPSANIASILETDAPANLTLQRIDLTGSRYCMLTSAPTKGLGNESSNNTETKMIEAVVGDLKVRLTEVAKEAVPWQLVAPLA